MPRHPSLTLVTRDDTVGIFNFLWCVIRSLPSLPGFMRVGGRFGNCAKNLLCSKFGEKFQHTLKKPDYYKVRLLCNKNYTHFLS